MLTAKQLAELLNGREIYEEITKEEELQAKESKLVVVFGASDDLMEFRGAIDDELRAYKGNEVMVDKNGLVEAPCMKVENFCMYQCELFKEYHKNTKKIKAIWGERAPNIDWTYETDIPHETFDIMEDGEVYCRGIVFSMDDLND
jgi:hypothetical protein